MHFADRWRAKNGEAAFPGADVNAEGLVPSPPERDICRILTAAQIERIAPRERERPLEVGEIGSHRCRNLALRDDSLDALRNQDSSVAELKEIDQLPRGAASISGDISLL